MEIAAALGLLCVHQLRERGILRGAALEQQSMRVIGWESGHGATIVLGAREGMHVALERTVRVSSTASTTREAT